MRTAAQNRREVLMDASISAEVRKGQVYYIYPTYDGGLERWHVTDNFAKVHDENPSIHFEVLAMSRAMRKP